MTSILGVSGLELYSSGTLPITFLEHSPRLGGTSTHLGGHGPGMPPCGAAPECRFDMHTRANKQKSTQNLNITNSIEVTMVIYHWLQSHLT